MALPMHSPFRHGHTQSGRVVLVVIVLLLGIGMVLIAGCDSATGTSRTGADVTFEGRVTDDAATARRSAAAVEGAVVTATTVTASGGTAALAGSATISAETATDVVVLLGTL